MPALERLPELESIDAAWLTAALRDSGLVVRARVTSHELEHVELFSTDIWRIRLTYDAVEAGAPMALIAKLVQPGRPLREGESFAAEARFYREVAPLTPARFARYVAGSAEDDPVQLLILEEVAARHFAWTPGAVDGHGELAVDALAAMHARWWGRAEQLAWIPVVGVDEGSHALDQRFVESWQAGEAVIRELTSEAFCELIEAMVGRVRASLAPLRETPTLLHGDAHGENMPLLEDGSDIVLLDWPGARLGLGACDLAAFVIMSYPPETRAEVERGLVERYAAALDAAGVPPRADPWLDYRRAVLPRVVGLVEFTPKLAARSNRAAWPADGGRAHRNGGR